MKISESSLFFTGICEHTHSKRTLVSLITELRKKLPAEVITLRGKSVSRYSFSEVFTRNRCVYIGGHRVSGRSLDHIYENCRIERFKTEETRALIRFFIKLIDAAKQYRDLTGAYPTLLMNSIYAAEDGSEITFLPYELIDYLNTFHNETLRRTLYLPIHLGGWARKARRGKAVAGGKTGGTSSLAAENEFVRTLGWLLYLCLTRRKQESALEKTPGSRGAMALYLGSLIKDAPAMLSDTLWSVQHGGDLSVDRLRDVLIASLQQDTSGDRAAPVPLLKRPTVIRLEAGLFSFASRRWKLLALVVILIGVGAYLLSDALSSRNRVDYTAGLSPRQVVELYYRGVHELDLEIIDAVFYRRAGKRIRDELSTVYVMLRMETAFGKVLVQPEDIDVQGYQPERHSVFGVVDLDVQQTRNGARPVFHARYRRIISSGEELRAYHMEETIYLEYIDNRWYITESDRTVETISQIQEIP
jgi:hypothetical protein